MRALPLLLLAACGRDPVDDDDTDVEPPPDCLVDVAFTGDFAGAIAGDDAVACVDAFAGEADVWMSFYPTDGDVGLFEVEVADVTAGGTGTFPAAARLRLRDDRSWTAGSCTAVVDEHTYQDTADGVDAYLFVGTGSCAAPAVDADGGEVEVGPFAFRFVSHWFL